jgi:hypothetical protein
MGSRAGRCARAAALAAALLAPAAAAGEDEGPDAEVLRKIAALRAQALGLRVDGLARDWKPFPSFEDSDGKETPHPAFDLKRISLAPRDDDLLVLLETAGTPPTAAAGPGAPQVCYQIDIDFLGRSARDASLQFGAGGAWNVKMIPESGKSVVAAPQGIEVAVADSVEVRIPLAPLATAIGGEDGKAWLEGRRRPWVRVFASTWKGAAPTLADEGPAAASFVLSEKPPALDPPLRADGEPRRAVRLPLEGTWFVRQGDHGLWSHEGIWAYDLAIVDHALRPTATPGSKRIEDYFGWGRPVVAPEAGRVVLESQPCEDQAPLDRVAGKDSGNTIAIRLEDGFRLSFGHLQKGSVAFHRDASFPAGATLAKVGNSGNSGAPHLHLFLSDRPGDYEGLPLALRDVRVGLNPAPDDPWVRTLPTWTIREGWFVQPK